MFTSIIQILKVNDVVKGISKAGNAYERHSAECLLLDNTGAVQCVGRLVIPTDLRDSAKVGMYSANFTLRVPTFGDRKGDIEAALVGLLPITKTAGGLAAAAPSKAA